jgi:Domain of unknown function (DUF4878)
MLKKILFRLVCICLLASCNSSTKQNPVTDTDVATAFIRAILDNDLKTAEKYLLVDETNQQYFQSFHSQYQAKDKSELEKYKTADIIINTLEPQNDSVTIVNYSNSYKKDIKTKLKAVRKNGQWLIDLKYTFTDNR